ncbi:hypothetical protein TorRG33x02_322000 [Trema orientale]|uniref:Uncharacterized protein n=1 Tax=Trema orientale TaxID=63057 RepID=A0A2P5BGF6_TREOI|nr:hypothetical protein TorRG33x02_322000 [Trema orientale]
MDPRIFGKVFYGGENCLLKVILWRIRDGTQVRLREDPWLPRPLTFRPITRPLEPDVRVTDLIMYSGVWNEELIDRTFCAFLNRDAILSIPLSDGSHSDGILWHYEDSGSYTVKSRYRFSLRVLALLFSQNDGGSFSGGP